MKIIRKERTSVVSAFFLTVMPVLVGLLKWNDLPERVPVYFGRGIEPSAYALKTNVVFFIPLILLGIFGLCLLLTVYDDREEDLSELLFRFRLWIAPVISLAVCFCVYAYDENGIFRGRTFLFLFAGLFLILFGEHMPGGIKLSEEKKKTLASVLIFVGTVTVILAFLVN